MRHNVKIESFDDVEYIHDEMESRLENICSALDKLIEANKTAYKRSKQFELESRRNHGEHQKRIEQIEQQSKRNRDEHQERIEQIEQQSNRNREEHQKRIEKIEHKSKRNRDEHQERIEQIEQQFKRNRDEHQKRVEQFELESKRNDEEHEKRVKKAALKFKKWKKLRKKRAREIELEFKKKDEQFDKRTEQFARELAELKARLDNTAAMMDKSRADWNKQMGDLGNSHGKFVESMAIASIKRIITEEYEAKYQGSYVHRDGKFNMQIDAWGVREDPKEVFLFEIKSKFRAADIKQVSKQISKFRQLEPRYRSAPIYAFIAAGVIDEANEQRVWQAGIQLLKFSDGLFYLLEPPKDFKHHYEFGMKQNDGNHRMVLPPFYLEQLARSLGSAPKANLN